MSRFTLAITTALIAVAALVTVPGSGGGAGAATACVAWAALPARVALGGRPVVVHATLQGTPACRGITADAGGTAVLNGPGPSTSDYPLLWSHVGAQDTATFYASLARLGTYRISGGDLQTYDAKYWHIPFTWRSTSTTVKYAGRFAGTSRGSGRVSATLQYHDKNSWRTHTRVLVALQRRSAGSAPWHTVARTRSTSAGRVAFRISAGRYRLVSASTGLVWGSVTAVPTRSV